MKLNVKAFALTCALLWGIGLFFIAWWVMFFEGSAGDAGLLGRIYIGYSISPLGSTIGLLWGFVDGLIGGAVFAWLYNMIVSRVAA